MLRFGMLGSGSRGNSTVMPSGSTRVLIDCGFAAAESQRRLARLGLEPSDLDAILVTHEHADHCGGVSVFARRYGIPVWTTAGTAAAWREAAACPQLQIVNPHARFAIGDLEIEPYPVPHDAREPCQFVFGDGAVRVGLLSDAGHVTAHMRATLSGCAALLLECNHDAVSLAQGPYPPSLKRRVGGTHGHLSNAQAAGLLASMDCTRLQHLALVHLSERNNTPQLARAAVVEALDCEPDWPTCADQDAGLDWRSVA
jgi:phosphoribosyl 1,2-cyclic phosphodiesterase